MTSGLRKERHSVSDLKIHLVCVTKYRRKIFTTESLELIHKSIVEVSQKMDFNILEFNGESDHIHVLLEYPPKLSISQMVNSLKGVSSRRYGQAGYPKPYSKYAAMEVLVTLCQQLGVRHSKFLKSTSKTKKSRRRTTGF